MNIYYTKKIINSILTPAKMKVQFMLLLENLFKFRKFSFNMNSRAYWDCKFDKFGDTWRDEHYRHLEELLPPDGRFSFLDIGCALGDGCIFLKEKFPEALITGADFSLIAIEKAKKKNTQIQWLLLDILKDRLPGCFDYISIIQTLEHFPDPFSVVNKCLRHARKSLIISVPYSPGYSGKFIGFSDHRYLFNENTFSSYKGRIIKVATMKAKVMECIFYEIFPS